MSLRVVIVTRIPPVLQAFDAVVRATGNEPVAFLTMRNVDGRYGPPADTGDLVMTAADELDVLLPARRSTVAPLLASVEADLVVCMGFPWKIPPEALAVPRLGWLNGHPSLLPRHRGPLPVAWAIREGDEEIGITFHRMDAELDTGPILAQRRYPLGELQPPDTLLSRVRPHRRRGARPRRSRSWRPATRARRKRKAAATSRSSARKTRGSTSRGRRRRCTGSRGPGAMRCRSAERAARCSSSTATTVRVLATSLTEVEGAQRLDCGDGPLWIVETEDYLSEEEATPSTDPAPSTQ